MRQFSLVLVKNRKNALYRRNAESEFLSRAVALENRYISGRTIVNAKFTRPSPKESYVNIVRKLCPALPFFFHKRTWKMILHHYEGIVNVCLYFLNRFKSDCGLGEQYASQRFPTIAIDILLQIFIRTEAKCILPFIEKYTARRLFLEFLFILVGTIEQINFVLSQIYVT